MKKTTFYSLCGGSAYGGGIKRVPHNGYTDGTYNYYKNGSRWYAIVPENGISAAE